jgi:hypothetical protein
MVKNCAAAGGSAQDVKTQLVDALDVVATTRRLVSTE